MQNWLVDLTLFTQPMRVLVSLTTEILLSDWQCDSIIVAICAALPLGKQRQIACNPLLFEQNGSRLGMLHWLWVCVA